MNCGSFFVADHMFCETCYNIHIEPRLSVSVKELTPRSSHAYMIDWAPGESDLVSQMVYRFKADRSTEAWAFYAKLFAQLMCEQIDLSGFDAFVPLPGSKTNSTHAHIFAKQLSLATGLPVLNALLKSHTSDEQKNKTAAQRHNTSALNKITLSEVFTNDELANLNLIYVDDIMTTGSTYQRAQEAIGTKGYSMLATLFYRPKLSQT